VLPAGLGVAALLGVGLLAGIGFTMSLFIAALAFGDSPLESAAKAGVLGASLLAAAGGLAILSRVLPKKSVES